MADARDESRCARRSRGIEVVASLAGPFLELGLAPVRPRWRRARTTSTRPASRSSSASCTTGFDAGHGRAAGLRVRLRPGRPRRAPCRGEGRRAAGRGRGRVFGQRRRYEPGHAPDDRPRDGSEAGRLAGRPARPVRASARRRARVRFPFGERTVVEWGGTEPLTVPRHTDVRNVRSYIRAPGDRREGRRRSAGSPRRSSAPPRASALPGRRRRPGGRAASRSSPRRAAPAARAAPSSRAPTSTGSTALLIVRGAEALLAGEARGAGVLAPAEAFDARTLRRPARAVPADRGVMSSGPALTVRVNATAPNAERGRVLRPLLRVAGRGRREGRQRRRSGAPATRRPSPASCSVRSLKTSSTPANPKPPRATSRTSSRPG